MKTTLRTASPKTNGAFSLVELLVVIAVIGILSAIMVPALAGVSEKSAQAADRRNAQNLASMATNAMASGNMTIPAATTTEEVVDLLVEGVTGTGSFEGIIFKISSLDPTDRADVLALLDWSGGILQYRPG